MACISAVTRQSKWNVFLLRKRNAKFIFSLPLSLQLSYRHFEDYAKNKESTAREVLESHSLSHLHGGERKAEMNPAGDDNHYSVHVENAGSAKAGAGSSPSSLKDSSHDGAPPVKEFLIEQIISHDKEIFELKRQHELSMLRVEQHQRRLLKDQDDRGIYYEQNCNVHTFDTVSVGLHSQRSTLYHTMSLERLRNLKIMLTILVSIVCCWYIYYRYVVNPNFEYIEKPMKMLGSRVQAIREMNWDRMNDEEKLNALSVRSQR